MNVSGSLHFYSGDDKELFFVFDDVVAQDMYRDSKFNIDDLESRRVYISVGSSRLIHQRTLSFSRKQTEIKVSLCSRNTKDGLGSLTALYNWFARRGVHPTPFGVLGRLAKVRQNGTSVWELTLTEPEGLITPPGLARRRKTKSRERRSFEHRREIQQRDLTIPGRRAEELALKILRKDFAAPNYTCLWRKQFLDSERIEIRKMGIIADIDVWNVTANVPERFIEAKAQRIIGVRAKPIFHFSSAEWRSYRNARARGVTYEVWLFQYRDTEDLKSAPQSVTLIIFDEVSKDWLAPEGYLVAPPSVGAGRRRKLRKVDKS
jgi:hypothetical protein